MFGTLDDNEIELILRDREIGRLGCHAEGMTYVVPISYAYDGESILMHTHEGLKVDIMRKNPGVCFQVDDIVNKDNWKSVIVWGEFEEITDAVERNIVLKQLTHRIFPLTISRTVHVDNHKPSEPEEVPYIQGIVCRIRVFKKTGHFDNSRLHPLPAYGQS